MTVSQKIGLALQEAREKSEYTQTQADMYIHKKFGTAPDSLSHWERGDSIPPSRIVLDLLARYDADIYQFMLTCGMEEAHQIIYPDE